MGNIELFDQMAERYDTAERIEVAKWTAAAIRRRIGDARKKQAVDYGCGTGLVGLNLVDLFASMLLVDASPQMVQQVEHKIKTMGLQTARALCCDLMSESWPEQKVDFIMVVQVLLHIPDVPSILARLHSLLKPGGHLLVVDFNKARHVLSTKIHNGFDQSTLARLCQDIGFLSTRTETFYEGQHILMGQNASLFLLDAVNGSME